MYPLFGLQLAVKVLKKKLNLLQMIGREVDVMVAISGEHVAVPVLYATYEEPAEVENPHRS
jgi:hypothetical protein